MTWVKFTSIPPKGDRKEVVQDSERERESGLEQNKAKKLASRKILVNLRAKLPNITV